jgi:predicted metal-dependent phosphoesterase TrpH
MERFDFHAHSNVSDGSLSPTDVVREAAAAGVVAFALTDHDTIDGIAEAQAAGRALGVEVIAGIELSVSERDGARSLHVLGLHLDPDEPRLRARLAEAHDARGQRAARIVEALRAHGVALELEHVQRIAGDGSIGRPHVARALVEIGACRDPDDAFTRWLRRGKPAYVPNSAFSARGHRAGARRRGVAVLAHPPPVRRGHARRLEAFVESLVPLGLTASRSGT